MRQSRRGNLRIWEGSFPISVAGSLSHRRKILPIPSARPCRVPRAVVPGVRFTFSALGTVGRGLRGTGPERMMMRDIGSLFVDYAAYHKTPCNKWFHRVGIPMIMLSLLGMLARVPIAPHIDAAIVLIVIAEIVYLMLDWKL